MNIKKILAMVLVIALTAAVTFGVTVAFLTDETETKHNVFTSGNVNVELTEKTEINGENVGRDDGTGGDYELVVPGDKLTKTVTVTNKGNIPAYVAVTVTMNNANKINSAIENYELDPYYYTDEQIQQIYDDVFDGWDLNYSKTDADGNPLGMRLTVDRVDGTLLHVDSTKTTAVMDTYFYGYNNWFQSQTEAANSASDSPIYGLADWDAGYYSKDMEPYTFNYTYYLLVQPGQSYTLFEGLNVPEYFKNEQMAMFDGLEIDISGAAIQAENFKTPQEAFAALYAEMNPVGTLVETSEELIEVLKNAPAGEPLYITLNGNIEMVTGSGQPLLDLTDASSVTIDGKGMYTLTATGAGVTSLGDDNAPFTLKNLTVTDKSVSYEEDSWEFGYLEIGGSGITCENVVFTDPIMVDSKKSSFTGCTFTGYTDEGTDDGKAYTMTMYGVWVIDGEATFTDCTFTGTRGMKICDQYSNEVSSVVIDGCLFDNLTEKPGVAIDDRNTQNMVVVIKNSTFTNCQAGDQGLYIYETDNTVPTLENNVVANNG